MSNYVIGLDGGGTKTVAFVADQHRNMLDQFQGGAINYNGGNKSLIDSNFEHIFKTIIKKGFAKEKCSAICIGTAGIGNPIVKQYILDIMKTLGYQCPILIVTDAETAFAGAIDNKHGIILIAGTGSICYGKDPMGNSYHVGGYGHLIDDEGSGYAIAKEILTAVVQANDGRIKPTILSDRVFEYLMIESIDELISYVYNTHHSKKEIAKLSELIEGAYEQKDEIAVSIINKCVCDLMHLVSPILKQLSGEVCLAVAGSVLLNNNEIYRLFVKKMHQLYPNVLIGKAKHNAAYGAVLLALEQIQDLH